MLAGEWKPSLPYRGDVYGPREYIPFFFAFLSFGVSLCYGEPPPWTCCSAAPAKVTSRASGLRQAALVWVEAGTYRSQGSPSWDALRSGFTTAIQPFRCVPHILQLAVKRLHPQ